MNEEQFLSPHDASRLADVSAATIRLWPDTGKLSSIRTAGGMRLFKRSDVEALAQKRKSKIERSRRRA